MDKTIDILSYAAPVIGLLALIVNAKLTHKLSDREWAASFWRRAKKSQIYSTYFGRRDGSSVQIRDESDKHAPA